MPAVKPAFRRHSARLRDKLLTWVIVTCVVVSLAFCGVLAYRAFRDARDSLNESLSQAGLRGSRSSDGPISDETRLEPNVRAREYQWKSARPFMDDVNGDGIDDVIGLIQERGSHSVIITAISGADWTTLWQAHIGVPSNSRERQGLRYEPHSRLILAPNADLLTAYDAQSGARRWISHTPERIDNIALDSDHLWVLSVKGKASEVSLADGTVTAGDAKPGPTALVLPDDEGYQLIPDLRTLDLKTNQFSQLLVRKGYCPKQNLPVVAGRHNFNAYIPCAHPHGLAFATAVAPGTTALPFLVGYDRKSKAERWRTQLTAAGTFETVASGFDQTRADLFEDEAVVSFVPTDGHPRVRRLSLVDGTTKWEVTLTRRAMDSIEGIVVGNERVLITCGGRLHVLERSEGTELGVLGGW